MRRPPDWLLGLLLLAGVYLWQRSTFPLWHIDLFHIQLAALSWHNDQPEKMYTSYDDYDEWLATYYRPQADRLGAWGDANAYFYPPFLAAIFAPVSDVHSSVWRNVVFVINVLLLFVFASQIVRLTGVQASWRGFAWALALVLICYPVARAAKMGQIVPLLAALFWEGLLRLRTSRRASSALIGSVIAIKIFPAAWLLWPLVRKQWKLIATVAGIVAAIYFVAVLAMGLPIYLRWWESVQEFGSVVYTYFGNQSPAGWFTRAVLGHSLLGPNFSPTPTILFARTMFAILFMGGTAWLLWRAREHPAPFHIEQGLMMSGILLALPVTWEHYYLFALPALGAVIFEEWNRRKLDALSILIAAAAFFFTMKLTRFYAETPVGRVISGSQCLGLMLFWAYCVVRIQRRPAATV